MHRRCVATYLGLAGALTLSVACTADTAGGTMFIVQNQVPDTSGEGGGGACAIPGDASGGFRQEGVFDIATVPLFDNPATSVGGGYDFYPLVESRVEVLDNQSEAQRTITVEGARVTLRNAGSSTVLDEYQLAFSGAILPDGGSTAFIVSLANSGNFDVFDAGEVVVAEVTIFGDLGGSQTESDPFLYPIRVCDGCLFNDLGDCGGVAMDIDPATGGECNPFQDAPVDCCTSGITGRLLCPAVSEMM